MTGRLRIDLHTHSTASDGTTPPARLMTLARESGLDVIALTDHDTVDGLVDAWAALPDRLTLVPGAELSCRADGVSLHLLAYRFDEHEPVLAAAMQQLRDSRVGRAEAMARSLEAAGTGVTWEQVRSLAEGTVGRPHLARALVQRGLVPTVAEAFTPEWIGAGGRHWVDKAELDVLEAIALVRAAGGVTVFAHPGADARGETVPDTTIAAMAAAGLVGLEVDHVDHPPATRARLRGLAGELGLVVTGSSDFHGDNKAVRLGENTTDPDAYEVLLG